jgi:3-hydroxyacyl-[acyl-carrier-protein] dehydratase
MRYSQLDRIVALEPGRRLVAQRTLRADEHYLQDHFPKFPVMPGVMMLEALHQAAMWMIRAGDHFACALVLLKEARGVKFGDFLSPGETLDVTVEWLKDEGSLVSVKAVGEKAGRTTVAARLVLEKCSTTLSDRLGTDQLVADAMRDKFETLFGPLDQINNEMMTARASIQPGDHRKH